MKPIKDPEDVKEERSGSVMLRSAPYSSYSRQTKIWCRYTLQKNESYRFTSFRIILEEINETDQRSRAAE